MFLHILLILSIIAGAQDKVYMMDGSYRLVKVLEIAPEEITIVPLSESGAPFRDANETLYKRDVVLIEYKNGLVEIYNNPYTTAVYNSDGIKRKDSKITPEFTFNFASINTLALCNADISLFFERILKSKKFGLGFMAAYNFNRYVIGPNIFLEVLDNAKKKYDIGAIANFYPGHFKRKTSFYFGAMIKYTAFSFSKVVEENNGTSININYIPAKGSQLATIVDIGTHTLMGKNFFFKTMAGIGAYKLRGDFKQQFNYKLNRDKKSSDPEVHYSFLPKIYIGLNIGYNF